ncbi:hypothetical protein [Salinimicrobium sp. TH3]|uniref:hypothetical protein n=1 Tax=Salinimicrobium sp. TH3 TaxID=2997342 RepID=UPI002274008B|nr:hypothetical protein [Salinimicrobium sp. TH3]MCY2685580.1 hypothetical protein [Salinimicrobium sp. TH3]
MAITSFTRTSIEKPIKDTIRIKGGNLNLQFNILSGKQGDYWVLYAPAINISGYGKTEEEAKELLDVEIEVFCEDVMGMRSKEREAYIASLGFSKEPFKTKNFSKAYVDQDGKLQDFEQGTLEHRVLTTAA